MLVGMFPETCDYIFFKMNQAYIASTLCVQKEIKSNTCQGKCYLKKMLTESQDQELPYAPQEKENTNVNLYCLEIEEIPFPLPLTLTKKETIYSTIDLCDRLTIDKLLRPPDYS